MLFGPAMLLGNAALELAEVSGNTLRLRDRKGPADAVVDFEIDADGRSVGCRAERPRAVGRQFVLNPWIGTCAEFREWEGMRVAYGLQAAWRLEEREFVYFATRSLRLRSERSDDLFH
jgi:hypothetical protein